MGVIHQFGAASRAYLCFRYHLFRGFCIGALLSICCLERRVQNNSQALVYSSDKLAVLKKELEQLRVPLSDRIADDELNRFLLAANNDVKTCVKLVQRNMRWRETFYFFPQYELEKWSALVFWHGYDAHKRPSLIVRIGLAYSILDPHERPRFAQAILSQVEYGITHLLHEEDPRITVIIDCEGTPALGFPINMLKSCSDRVQDNYPTRLAALFVVNLPPVVRLLTQTIIQVLKPNTKRKIFVEGEQYNALAEHYGDVTAVPRFLGGACTCSYCTKKMTGDRVRLQLLDKQASNEDEDADDPYVNETPMQEFTSCSRFNFIIRAIIIGFLTLWVVISFLAIFFDPEIDFIPT
ncbi:hypothetical protein KP509_01G053900 [Ceratopteris richardii]|uniref:CRAL-TRIO domain-containing protein n=1 Tax=Ceratopteris richardii TaxID=49495 RepID=A0A8T2VD27_CERRI|nr:hypothetical protein KP509_01G053900 [Ceratopteris richardii]